MTSPAAYPALKSCPCGSGRSYGACCQPCHAGAAAPTPEALMRSRYTAYALRLEAYLLATWHPTTRPGALGLDQDGARWLGLKVHRAQQDGERGLVEFTARYQLGREKHALRETSAFVFEEGRWYYLDGTHP